MFTVLRILQLLALFFLSLRTFLQFSEPFTPCGDFSCVEDSPRGGRGPGRGHPSQNAVEVRRWVLSYSLSNYFVALHGQVFSYTWSHDQSAIRLD